MEEIWEIMGGTQGISYEPWPTFDEALTVENQVEIVFQINGKVKAKAVIELDLPKDEMEQLALSNEVVQ